MTDISQHHKKHRTSLPKDFFRSVNIRFLIHELKGPLDVLETNIKMIEGCGPFTDQQQRAFVRAIRSAAKLRNIINSLLEVGSSQAGRFDIQRFSVMKCSTEVLIEALEAVTSRSPGTLPSEENQLGFLHDNGLSLSVSDEARELFIVHDKAKFSCILGNLIRNCLRFRKQQIVVELSLAESHLEISVSDDGPGVDLESIKKLFNQHEKDRLNHAPSKNEGHGLGFVSSVILAHYMGGDSVVDTEYARGGRFILTLPISFDDKKARENGYEVDETNFITSC